MSAVCYGKGWCLKATFCRYWSAMRMGRPTAAGRILLAISRRNQCGLHKKWLLKKACRLFTSRIMSNLLETPSPLFPKPIFSIEVERKNSDPVGRCAFNQVH